MKINLPSVQKTVLFTCLWLTIGLLIAQYSPGWRQIYSMLSVLVVLVLILTEKRKSNANEPRAQHEVVLRVTAARLFAVLLLMPIWVAGVLATMHLFRASGPFATLSIWGVWTAILIIIIGQVELKWRKTDSRRADRG